jgi:tRNA 5-methylaminomethyl-2-thiouridine biosynthesis bifunctional protein
MYDIAIVGAGINGSSVAYEFLSRGKSVIIFDMLGVAKGGSGAAGAFISPKFAKHGDLKDMLSDAFIYSMEFYEKNFPDTLRKAKLIHIAKDEKDAEVLKYFKKHTKLDIYDDKNSFSDETISISAGIVDAKALCGSLCRGAKFVHQEVKSIIYDDDRWVIDESYSAKEIVLATGAYEPVVKEPYMKIRGIWGHRIDVKTTTENKNSLHQFVSISPSKDGVVAIGATHNVHYHPQKSKEQYDIQSGRDELLYKASKTIDLKDVEVIADYTGLRSGSVDYMPILGSLVISKETLACGSINFERKDTPYERYDYYPHLHLINGNGGYGFVLAPYLAKQLCDNILADKKIDKKIAPARFFARWARRL